jgi:hypothetical protein
MPPMTPTRRLAALLLLAFPAQSGDPAKPAIAIQEEAARAKPPPAPAGAERAGIGETIRRNTDQIQACYAKALEHSPLLFGKLVAEFDIGPNGKVIEATADGIADHDLLVCVVQAVRKWEFANPLSGGKLRVRYPWKLEPRATASPQNAAPPAASVGSTPPAAAR